MHIITSDRHLLHLHKARANELLHTSSMKGGQDRTACCRAACWDDPLCAWHRHGLRWPGWRSPTSTSWLKALGRPCGICCHGAALRPGTGPALCSPRLSAEPQTWHCLVNRADSMGKKWQGHPSLCLKDLHLPHSARLSWSRDGWGLGCWSFAFFSL